MSNTPHQPCPFVDCVSSDAFNWNDDGKERIGISNVGGVEHE